MSNETRQRDEDDLSIIYDRANPVPCAKCGKKPVVSKGNKFPRNLEDINIYSDEWDVYMLYCRECKRGTEDFKQPEMAGCEWNKLYGEQS